MNRSYSPFPAVSLIFFLILFIILFLPGCAPPLEADLEPDDVELHFQTGPRFLFKDGFPSGRDVLTPGDFTNPSLIKVTGVKEKLDYTLTLSLKNGTVYRDGPRNLDPAQGETQMIRPKKALDFSKIKTPETELKILYTYRSKPLSQSFKLRTARYEIYSYRDLLLMKNDLAGHYRLMDNIRIPDPGTKGIPAKGLPPVGRLGAPFTGTFDGNGKTISNYFLEDPGNDYSAFFGYVNTALGSLSPPPGQFKNLRLELKNTGIKPAVTGGRYTASFIGILESGVIENVHVSAPGNGSLKMITGQVGFAGESGGLVASVQAKGIIRNSSAELSVYIQGSVGGGFAGLNEGLIQKSFARGVITVINSGTGPRPGGSDGAGGLVGKNTGTIQDSYARGILSHQGDSYVLANLGGLVGLQTGSSSLVENSYAALNVIDNIRTVNSSSAGIPPFIGGFIGKLTGGGTILQSYAASPITKHTDPHASGNTYAFTGVVDFSSGGGTIQKSFYDTSKTTLRDFPGVPVTGKNPALLKPANFATWIDFSLHWKGGNGSFPTLLWQKP